MFLHQDNLKIIALTSLLILAVFFSCSSKSPVHRSPLARTNWDVFDSNSNQNKSPDKNNHKKTDQVFNSVRSKTVYSAGELLKNNNEHPGYGFYDVIGILEEVSGKNLKTKFADIEKFVNTASKNDSLKNDYRPLAGDIVLFHNEWDKNNNQVADDWYTGCGIIVKSERKIFHVITRTGHAPRKIFLAPYGPFVRKQKSKIINSYLRIPKRSDPKDTFYLSGRMYAGYIDLVQFLNNN